MVTLGTGIGTAVFVDGTLVPSTEYGHLVLDGTEAEDLASTRAEQETGQSWKEWSWRLGTFLRELKRLMWPDRFIIEGGISAEFRRFRRSLEIGVPVLPARLGNDAGILGAALALGGREATERGVDAGARMRRSWVRRLS